MTIVDEYKPRRNIRIDTTFWQHRSIFHGTQEQLDELRHDADARAAERARIAEVRALERSRAEWAEHLRSPLGVEPRYQPSPRRCVFDVHRPAIRRLKAIVHVGFIPLLWAITTCHCGDRWPCNDAKQHLRRQVGWTVDITDELKAITRQLPRPRTRLSFLRRQLTRRLKDSSDKAMSSPTSRRLYGYNGREST